jgi:uncharacterized membrane protein HdeD (DUF308 family)
MTGSSPQTPATPAPFAAVLARSVRDHWWLFLIEGIVLVLLGVLAIALPAIASLAVTILVGWLLLIGGIVGLITSWMSRGAPGFAWSLISALLATVVGFVLLWSPFRGEISLTLVLVVFFLVDGVASIMLAVEHRRELSGMWGWLVVTGVVDLILAAIILSGFPQTAAWVLGLLVGIDLLFGGASLLAIALAARRAA